MSVYCKQQQRTLLGSSWKGWVVCPFTKKKYTVRLIYFLDQCWQLQVGGALFQLQEIIEANFKVLKTSTNVYKTFILIQIKLKNICYLSCTITWQFQFFGGNQDFWNVPPKKFYNIGPWREEWCFILTCSEPNRKNDTTLLFERTRRR